MTLSISTFKPYFFTSYYNWFTDNGVSPHLAVDTSVKNVKVPVSYVKNNQILLNISPVAIHDYTIDNKGISFKAMFRGVSEDIHVPYKAMKALIALEDGIAIPISQLISEFDTDDSQEESQEDGSIFSLEQEEHSDTDNTISEDKSDSKKNSHDGPGFEFV